MASPYKIPKKKQTGDSDSTQVHLQSPLSRLQSPATPFKGFGDQSSRRGTNRMHAGTTQGSSPNSQRVVVKTLLGLNSPSSGEALAANHRSPGGLRRQSQGERREDSSSASTAMGWRPKRASDRLLQPEAISKPMSPPQKKKVEENSGLSSESESLSVVAVDTLAELRMKRGTVEGKSASHSGTHHTPQDNRTTPHRSSLSSVCSPRTTPDRRRSLDRSLWTTAGANLKEDVRERQRQKWREFKERTSVTQPRPRRRKQNPVEPIVLCSEDDGEGEDEDDGPKRTSQTDESCLGGTEKKQGPQTVDHVCPPRAEGRLDKSSLPGTLVAQPSFLQLKFSSLHVGLTHATAHGKMLITENSITIPLRVSAEEGEVTVVASQVRGYGVWDGGVARGGTLLAGWEGPAPSLLFLWITDAQANLLQRELSAMHATAVTSGPSCSFLLLVLKEQLQELEAALLASILDMEEYKKGRSSSSPSCSSSSGLASPLDWTDGLLLLHTCPPPLDQHLLRLLGHSADTSGQVRSSQRNKTSSLSSSRLQQLPTRLIQYPAAPCKGRISVTKEDLDCLDAGQFLNDVIIDFYLKYLLLEGVGGAVAERSHVFSSFFYKQLSRRRAAGEDNGPSVPDRHMRHQRVKTWTRHVDIFTKDFLFVPVNQEAHWFLVVVCFPGLDKVQYQDFERRQGGSERGGKASVGLRSQQPPECTQQGCQKNSVLKRPCILVMNSLKLLNHENVCRLVRDYLQVEWEVRRGTPRLFTADNMRSSNCRVPQQDNSSDCGLYLLQYVESFLQNPVVHFDLPLRLDNWFPRQRARQKREEIRSLILKMHQRQQPAGGN